MKVPGKLHQPTIRSRLKKNTKTRSNPINCKTIKAIVCEQYTRPLSPEPTIAANVEHQF